MADVATLPGPKPRQAAIAVVVGYVIGFGVPYASFGVLPRLFDPSDAARTSQNVLANQGPFAVAVFAFVLAFAGDVLAAWGLYYLLRPASASFGAPAARLRRWLGAVLAVNGAGWIAMGGRCSSRRWRGPDSSGSRRSAS